MTSIRLLERVLLQLGPIPDGALLIGAQALALLEQELGAVISPLETMDVDIAVRLDTPRHADISSWLRNLPGRVAATYAPEWAGGYPGGDFVRLVPISEDWPAVEFLAQVPGDRSRWVSPSVGVVPMVPGNLQLLFIRPWGLQVSTSLEVQTPNPLTFVLQKVVLRRARGEDTLKDAGAVLRCVEAATGKPAAVRGLLVDVECDVGPWRRKLQSALRLFDDAFVENQRGKVEDGLRALGREVSGLRVRAAQEACASFVENVRQGT